ncbi:MHS family MFS transporter [Rhodococcus cerastii]|nr:MHS family MFS transporter [Rhodococcus cerastii]
MRKVALAGFVGSVIEFYDFYIYGTAAALVFPTVFFPDLSPAAASLASLATFAAAFIARPLGAVIFGHFGDRWGRKKTLVATLLIMGLSTVAVGCVPSAASIGVVAPIIILVLRLLQGISVGGEWSGAALLAAEYAPPGERGKWGMAVQLGPALSMALASAVFLGVNLTVGESSPAFLSWGWRIPFLVSAVLIGVALWVRLGIEETPVFREHQQSRPTEPAPLMAVMREQWRRILAASASVVAVFAFVFMGSVYLTGYANTHVGLSRTWILAAGVAGGLVMMVTVALSGHLSDRFGRRRMITTGLGVALPWSFAVLPMIDTGSPAWFIAAIAGTFAIVGLAYGPVAAFLPETFPTRYRYTGTGIAFNTAGILGGAVPPLIAVPLLTAYGSLAIGCMLAILTILSLAGVAALPDTCTHRALHTIGT